MCPSLRYGLALGWLTLAGCVSSTDHDRLTRQHQLLQLEKQNSDHERQSAEKELKDARATASRLEQELAELRQLLEDRQRDLTDLERQIGAERARRGEAEAQLSTVLEALSAGKLGSREERSRLLEELRQRAAVQPSAQPSADAATH